MLRHLWLVFFALSLASCGTPGKMAWQHYDECQSTTTSFIAMAECGKQRRLAYCADAPNCGEFGASLTQYADSLAQAVRSGEMSDAQARQRFILFKTDMAQRAREQQIATSPVTCIHTGSVTTCG